MTRLGWVLGFCERESQRLGIFRVVPNRTSETLIPLITRHVSLNTALLVTDGWRSYR